MAAKIPLPTLGYVLRKVITAVGYRGYVVDKGLDKDLDDLAIEARPGVIAELMAVLEDKYCDQIAKDCGNDWAQLIRWSWFRFREAYQTIILNADTSPLADEQRQTIIFVQFFSPMLAGFLTLCLSAKGGPDADLWWRSPFEAWFAFATKKLGIMSSDHRGRFADKFTGNQRAFDRWKAGESIKKLSPPFSEKIEAAALNAGAEKVTRSDVELLSGWLLLAIGYQSLSKETRESGKNHVHLQKTEKWSVATAIKAMNRTSQDYSGTMARDTIIPILQEIEILFAETPRNLTKVQH
jgi:hypothetical protein